MCYSVRMRGGKISVVRQASQKLLLKIESRPRDITGGHFGDSGSGMRVPSCPYVLRSFYILGISKVVTMFYVAVIECETTRRSTPSGNNRRLLRKAASRNGEGPMIESSIQRSSRHLLL